ncbi:unnamed protein product [Thelazia callipaeda]|uniref:Uncharacterized protein n=1 Tax=Thelazia callipaeda TaxID=103827 RepID=A0A0N5DBY7_THECL|nr:unnamed protein product [Thelazia callipaeda]
MKENLNNSKQAFQENQKTTISSGRIGERLIIRTTTTTGQGLRYTLTRPFTDSRSYQFNYHGKSGSDNSFHITSVKNSSENLLESKCRDYASTSRHRSSSVDSRDCLSGEVNKNYKKSLHHSTDNVSNAKKTTSVLTKKNFEKLEISDNLFTREFSDNRSLSLNHDTNQLSSLIPQQKSKSTLLSPLNSRIIHQKPKNNYTNNIDKLSQVDQEINRKPRYQVRKRAVFIEQPKTITDDSAESEFCA